MALVYETGGSWAEMPLVWVDMVSSVVTPRDTRAGMACWSSQKLTHDTITNIQPETVNKFSMKSFTPPFDVSKTNIT